jgi:hypothetical protein
MIILNLQSSGIHMIECYHFIFGLKEKIIRSLIEMNLLIL